MDTPFGRLSYYHRKNLINLLPQMASQWVLLATDTEFSLKEANELRNTGLWSKMYILNATDKGNTVIEERDIDSAILFLKDR
jgi:DNA sulfur modification protein DndD